MIPSMYETVKFYRYGGIISRSDLRWLPHVLTPGGADDTVSVG